MCFLNRYNRVVVFTDGLLLNTNYIKKIENDISFPYFKQPKNNLSKRIKIGNFNLN